MKSIILNLLLIVMILFIFSSCKNNPNEPKINVVPPDNYMNATMPLSINNKWIYVDSSFESENNVRTHLEEGTISDYKLENNIDWWELNTSDGSQYYFSVQNNIVYKKSKMNGLPNQEIEYFPSTAIKDTVLFSQLVPYNQTPTLVKVYLYKGKFKTPAGSFDSVYVYESFELPSRIVKYFKPKIGQLGVDVYSPSDISKITFRARLLYYSLN